MQTPINIIATKDIELEAQDKSLSIITIIYEECENNKE